MFQSAVRNFFYFFIIILCFFLFLDLFNLII